MNAFVKVYKVIVEQNGIQGEVAKQINAALGQDMLAATLTSAINHLVVAKLIDAQRQSGKWNRVWLLSSPSQEQIAAMDPMVRARYVFAILQMTYDPSLTTTLTAAQLEEGLRVHFPYLHAGGVMARLFGSGFVKRPLQT